MLSEIPKSVVGVVSNSPGKVAGFGLILPPTDYDVIGVPPLFDERQIAERVGHTHDRSLQIATLKREEDVKKTREMGALHGVVDWWATHGLVGQVAQTDGSQIAFFLDVINRQKTKTRDGHTEDVVYERPKTENEMFLHLLMQSDTEIEIIAGLSGMLLKDGFPSASRGVVTVVKTGEVSPGIARTHVRTNWPASVVAGSMSLFEHTERFDTDTPLQQYLIEDFNNPGNRQHIATITNWAKLGKQELQRLTNGIVSEAVKGIMEDLHIQ